MQSPTEQGIKLYSNALLKTYNQQLAKLNGKKKVSDVETNKLQALRQVLIEKNLAGIYSDEIFKEQNTIIEKKLVEAHAAQSDELIEKYDINAILKFLEERLSDLSKTYTKSSPIQLRSLLSKIFMSEFLWNYPGYSYSEFSPTYQAIRDADKPGAQIGCRTWIRTKMSGFRVHYPTIR